MSDAPSFLRVRNFLALADAAAIALNVFRVHTSPLQGEPEFHNQPRTEERFASALQRIAAPMGELSRVRDAVFTDHTRTVALSFLSCLQDCYQSRGYAGKECEDPAFVATQTFVNLRGPIGPPGVDFGATREADDGWNSWRAIYAADGRQLVEYGRIRTQIIGLIGAERDMIDRERCFGLHPLQWPPHMHYATGDLVRMADEAHGILRNAPPTGVAPLANDVAVLETAPALPSPINPEPAPPGKPKGIPAGDAEVRVRDWLVVNAKKNPSDIRRDAVAEGTGVSKGAVSNTAAWKAFKQRRDADSKPVVREVPLTATMRVNIPAKGDSEELHALTEEQAEDDASDERRRGKGGPRHERRHGPS